jgi:hypothetical protein
MSKFKIVVKEIHYASYEIESDSVENAILNYPNSGKMLNSMLENIDNNLVVEDTEEGSTYFVTLSNDGEILTVDIKV